MKGISHFTSAVAVASFIPGMVESAAHGGLWLLLAGVGGLLPDWLDFKYARYFEPAELDLRADPANFDPQPLAEAIADAIERAYEEDDPLTVQLHSLLLGPDRWRSFSVRFDSDHNRVEVRAGPVINGAGRAIAQEDAPGYSQPVRLAARVPLRASMHYAYDGELRVESMEGPSFEFRRTAQAGEGDRVEVSFLPWHRRWTHSLLLGALFGAAAWLAFARTGEGALAGLALAAGYFTHVLEDQLGHLGSNLWWPLTERRSAGLKLLHSGDALPNFATVWAAVGLLLFNLDRAAAPPPFDPGAFLLWAVAVPVGVMLLARRRLHAAPPPQQGDAEVFDELVDTDLNFPR